VQVVARSVETALHKLHELHFDVRQVVSGGVWLPCLLLPAAPSKRLDARTTPSCTERRWSFGSTAMTTCSLALVPRFPPVPREIMAHRLPSCSADTMETSIRSIPCSSRPQSWSSGIYGQAAATDMASSLPTC
jgi:hypothetical protein